MATEILMPKQGMTVESCLLLEWKKQAGEPVKAGDVLCEVETDKATFEIEAEQAGTLLKIFAANGTNVPVLSPIAIIGQPGEDISQFVSAQVSAPPAAEATAVVPSPSPTLGEGRGGVGEAAGGEAVIEFVGISPRARNLAAAKGVNLAALTGTGPGGRVIERDVLAALSEKAPLTPAAIAALVEQGMQAPQVGTGIGGRVTRADLRKEAAPTPVVAAAAVMPKTVPSDWVGAVKEIPVKGVRKIIAARMLESLQTTAQVTLNASADASKLLAFRKRLKASPEALGLAGITINDLVLYAVARTLPRFTYLNAHFLGETIKEFERVHLGIAVDTSRGLMVPVARHADRLSLKELAQEAKRLSAACQEGKILPDELAGGTFTVTNLGALGIESFTPVLNPPEVGILGVCNIQPKPVMAGEEVSFAPHLGLSLTFDHRAVDGAPAARFLKELATALANFDLLLAG